jgi:uncharacterized protein
MVIALAANNLGGMIRGVVSLALLSALVIPSATAAGDKPSSVQVEVVKTRARISPFGSVEPSHPNRRVIVKLSRFEGDGYVLLDRKVVPLDGRADGDGDGVRESTFTTSFPAPAKGSCRIVTIFRGDTDHARSNDEEVFPCTVPAFGTGTATMTPAGTGSKEIDLLVARSGEAMQYGLMHRKRLSADKGMVFLFEQEAQVTFHMLNTLLPLSIAFFNSTGQIVNIVDMAPCPDHPPDGSCPGYSSEVPVSGALEVNQGSFETWGVEEGDLIDVRED